MSINLPPNKRRDALIRMPLADLAAWHLVVTCCACRQDRIVSIRSLVERYGGETVLLRLVPRFRCGVAQCRLPPVTVRLRNRLPVHPGPPLVEVVLLDLRNGGGYRMGV